MPDIFLSYSREDQATARRFAEAFQRARLSVWWDQALNPGEAFDDVTEKALEEARAVVVLWSKASVASRWVRAEATQANNDGKLVPVMIEPCKRPIMFELTHTADLSGWKGDDQDPAWQSFLAGALKFAGRSSPQASAPSASGVIAAPQSARWLPWAAALGLALLLGYGGWQLAHRRTGEATSANTAVPQATAQARRLLVLPFTSISADSSKDYVANGLTAELLTQLQQIRALTVLGQETSFAFQGKSADPADIRATYNVQYLLSGTVRMDGDRLKINPSLTDTATNQQLWTSSYEGLLKDLFALQEQIATEVARALSITLDAGELPRAEGGTNNVEAYDRYLMAFDHWARGDPAAAVRLLRECVKLDPDFVRAKITLSIWLAPVAGRAGAAAAAMAKERFDIIADLNSRNLPGPVGLQVRSLHSWWTRDWKTSVESGLAAAEAMPYARATAFMSLVSVGRVNEAIPLGGSFVANNPLEERFSQFLALALAMTGRTGELQAIVERLGEEGSRRAEDFLALRKLLETGSATTAQDITQLQASLKDPVLSAELPLLSSKPEVALQDISAVRQKLSRALDDPQFQDESTLLEIAQLARFYGDNELAFKALRKDLIELKYPWPFAVWQYPMLRGDPRFKDLVRDMGLVGYWKSSGKWSDFCKPVGQDDFTCQ